MARTPSSAPSPPGWAAERAVTTPPDATRGGDRHLERLVRYASFASVSADPAYAPALHACAAWLESELTAMGLHGARQIETGGPPVVVAERIEDAALPTVLVYGHYDVQPAHEDEGWTTPPFTPTVRGGRLVGRGVSDNKGMLVAALGAIEELLAERGSLPCNVRVLVEGEEETRADRLEELILARRGDPLLDADLALVTDSAFLAEDAPGLPVGLRGMVQVELTLRTAATDLHSGIYGGVAPNAAYELAVLLAGLKDPADGRVLVEGFHDGVQAVGPEERRAWEALPVDEAATAAEIGARGLVGERGFAWRERMWSRPSLDVGGIWGGYTGEGIKTVIPAKAHAKITCRVVPHQDAQAVLDALVRHLCERTPSWATLEIDATLAGAEGVLLPAGHPGVRAALAALRSAWPGEPAIFRAGYSVPVVDLLQRHAGIPSVMLGFMLPGDGVHAPDESVSLDVLERGRATYRRFLEELPRAMAEPA